MNECLIFFVLKIYSFSVWVLHLHVHLYIRRGHQIPLEMVVSHHAAVEVKLRTSGMLPWAISPAPHLIFCSLRINADYKMKHWNAAVIKSPKLKVNCDLSEDNTDFQNLSIRYNLKVWVYPNLTNKMAIWIFAMLHVRMWVGAPVAQLFL